MKILPSWNGRRGGVKVPCLMPNRVNKSGIRKPYFLGSVSQKNIFAKEFPPKWLDVKSSESRRQRVREFGTAGSGRFQCSTASQAWRAWLLPACRMTFRLDSKKPPKMRFENSRYWLRELTLYWLVKLMTCNSLTKFQCQAHLVTGNGSYVNKSAETYLKKTHKITSCEYIFGGF